MSLSILSKVADWFLHHFGIASIRRYGAVGDAKVCTGTIEVGTNLLAITSGVVPTARDVGKVISVFKAGVVPDGYTERENLITTIVSVDGDVVTLEDDAEASVEDAEVRYGTDNTGAIQRCITDNRVSVIPWGAYLFTTQFKVPSHRTVMGLGWGSRLLATYTSRNGVTAQVNYFTSTDAGYDGGEHVKFLFFHLLGAHTGVPSGNLVHPIVHGIRFQRTNFLSVIGMRISQCSGFAVNIGGCEWVFNLLNYIHDQGRDGITGSGFQNEPGHPLGRIQYYFCAFNVVINPGDDCFALHCSAGDGIVATTERPRYFVIACNVGIGRETFETGNFGRGVALSGVEFGIVALNIFNRSHQVHLSVAKDFTAGLQRSRYILLLGNVSLNAGASGDGSQARHGIMVEESDHIFGFANLVVDPLLDGMRVWKGATGVYLHGWVFGAAGWGFVSLGTSGRNAEVTFGGLARGCQHGNYVSATDGFRAENFSGINNNQALTTSDTTGSGLMITNSTKVSVHGGQFSDFQGSPTQRNGLIIHGTVDYLSIHGVQASGNTASQILDQSTGSTQKRVSAVLGYTSNGRQVLEANNGVLRVIMSGSPEGVITAPVGSEVIRTDGGAGTTRYFKESGVGNTGWVAK